MPRLAKVGDFSLENAIFVLKIMFFCIYLAKNFHFWAKIALFANVKRHTIVV